MDDLVYSSCQPFAWRCHHTREKQSRVGGKWLVLSVIANVALLLLYVSELSRTHTQAVSQNSAFGTESSTAIWGDTRNLRGKQITDLNSVAGSIDAEFHISRRRYLQEPGDDDQGSGDDKPTYQVALEFSAVVVLVFTSGLFSGLTLGLMGLETNQLRVSFFFFLFFPSSKIRNWLKTSIIYALVCIYDFADSQRCRIARGASLCESNLACARERESVIMHTFIRKCWCECNIVHFAGGYRGR